MKKLLFIVLDVIFTVLLVAAFVYGIWAYGSQIYTYGFSEGMNRLLWGCDDAIRIYAEYHNCAYSTMNILLFVFLEPLLILISCIGLRINNQIVRKIIFYIIISVGLYIFSDLTELYLNCLIKRFGGS